MCTYKTLNEGVQQENQKNHEPLDIGRIMLFDNNQKIYGIIVQSKIEKGVLKKIGELSEKLGVTIRYIQFSMTKAHETMVTVIAFIDLSNTNASPEKILETVKSQKFVINAQMIKPFRSGIIFDNYSFPLIMGNERVVIFRKSVYAALFKGIRKKFGSAGEAMLYYQGYTIGFEILERYVKIANSKSIEDLVEIAKAINTTLGWGRIGDVKIDTKKRTAQVQIFQNFECELGEKIGKPYSQFYRGAIAGLFTRFFGKDVKVEENKCIAKGDLYCEFIIKT